MSYSVYEAAEEVRKRIALNYTTKDLSIDSYPNSARVTGLVKMYSNTYFVAVYLQEGVDFEVAFVYSIPLSRRYEVEDFERRFNEKKNDFPYLYIYSKVEDGRVIAQLTARVWDKAYSAYGVGMNVQEVMKTLAFLPRAEDANKKLFALMKG